MHSSPTNHTLTLYLHRQKHMQIKYATHQLSRKLKAVFFVQCMIDSKRLFQQGCYVINVIESPYYKGVATLSKHAAFNLRAHAHSKYRKRGAENFKPHDTNSAHFGRQTL